MTAQDFLCKAQYIPGIACEDRFKADWAAGRYIHWEPPA